MTTPDPQANIPHDHEVMLVHLLAEWGTRGVILKALRDLTDDQACRLIEAIRRDLDKPHEPATDEQVPSPS
jgi:hypothetical protein